MDLEVQRLRYGAGVYGGPYFRSFEMLTGHFRSVLHKGTGTHRIQYVDLTDHRLYLFEQSRHSILMSFSRFPMTHIVVKAPMHIVTETPGGQTCSSPIRSLTTSLIQTMHYRIRFLQATPPITSAARPSSSLRTFTLTVTPLLALYAILTCAATLPPVTLLPYNRRL